MYIFSIPPNYNNINANYLKFSASISLFTTVDPRSTNPSHGDANIRPPRRARGSRIAQSPTPQRRREAFQASNEAPHRPRRVHESKQCKISHAAPRRHQPWRRLPREHQQQQQYPRPLSQLPNLNPRDLNAIRAPADRDNRDAKRGPATSQQQQLQLQQQHQQ